MSPAPRVVCLGEALVDLIATDGDGRRWRAAPGGAPYNAAVAAARLGAPTTFLGVLSGDRFGHLLRQHLDASGVDHAQCPSTAEPTTLALIHGPRPDDDNDFTFHVAGTSTVSARANDLHLPPDLGVLHVSGSVSLVLEPVASRLEGLLAAAQHRAVLQVDANPRPRLISRQKYLRRFGHWLGMADIVKLSVADLEWMSPGADAVATAQLWIRPDPDGEKHTPAVVVLTRGAAGAAVVHPAGVVEVEAPTVDVVDTIGAGDAFAGALLAAYASHEVTSRAALDALDVRWWRMAASLAGRAASVACTRPGADPARRSELS